MQHKKWSISIPAVAESLNGPVVTSPMPCCYSIIQAEREAECSSPEQQSKVLIICSGGEAHEPRDKQRKAVIVVVCRKWYEGYKKRRMGLICQHKVRNMYIGSGGRFGIVHRPHRSRRG